MSNTTSNTWTMAIDTGNTFILPSICFFGIVTNLINIKVFLNKRIKDIAFKYYLLNGFSNLFYLSICFFVFCFRCGTYYQASQLSATLVTKVYTWIFYTYIKGIFAFFTIFIQITLGFFRLCIVTNRGIDIFKRYKVICFIFFIISALIYTPNLYTQTILTSQVTKNNTTRLVYTMTTSSIGKTDFGKWSVIVVTILRGHISLCAMIIIDVYTFIKLKRQIINSSKLRG